MGKGVGEESGGNVQLGWRCANVKMVDKWNEGARDTVERVDRAAPKPEKSVNDILHGLAPSVSEIDK